MKIEDTPFQFRSGATQGPWQRQPVSVYQGMDDMDLAFLDLLSETTLEHAVQRLTKGATEASETKEESESTKEKQSESARKPDNVVPFKPKVSLEDPRTEVEKEMMLLQTELTAEDIQYLKQGVIPGLPILAGNVSVQNIFPTGADGEVSYKGFDVSPKLAELIEKGYKSGRPIRIELDPNSAVVLKIRDGRVSAEFLSNDKATIIYLQQELDELKQRMAARNLPVDTLSSRHSDQQREQQRRQEQDDESKE